MRLVFPPVPEEVKVFRPCKQKGLEEMTVIFIRVLADGLYISEGTMKELIQLLESGARVAIDRWLENGGAATVGLTWYLVEPTLTSAWQERKETGGIELHSSIRVVRGLTRVSGPLYRSLTAQAGSIPTAPR